MMLQVWPLQSPMDQQGLNQKGFFKVNLKPDIKILSHLKHRAH